VRLSARGDRGAVVRRRGEIAIAARQTATGGKRDEAKATRDFALAAARLAANTRCRDVAVLDLHGVWPVAEFFVVATGTSPRQMRSVCDEIEELAAQTGGKAYSRSGYEGETWIVVDFVDVVIHLFSQEARLYYDLDNLWGDAPKVAWEE